MSAFNLLTLDEFYLKLIVKKFNSTRSGGRFYRSCRAVKNFVDKVKPVWPLPHDDSTVMYIAWKRFVHRSHTMPSSDFELPSEFCRIPRVVMAPCFDDYFEKVVLPETETMGAVEVLRFVNLCSSMSEENIKLLMTAAKPKNVELTASAYARFGAAIENVENLHFFLSYDCAKNLAYWKTKEIFGIVANRRTVTQEILRINASESLIVTFLVNWLRGESTGSLEQLTFTLDLPFEMEALETIVNHSDIQRLATNCVQELHGWILERHESVQLRIFADGEARKIVFHF